MLSYLTIGANDVPSSGRFYAAVLVPLGYEMQESAQGIEFLLASGPGGGDGGAIYVKEPFDGKEATAGNGAMMAYEAPTQAMVRELHAAGLAAGGTDEGAPGYRAAYSDHFYVAYLRDPVGNKLAIFSTGR